MLAATLDQDDLEVEMEVIYEYEIDDEDSLAEEWFEASTDAPLRDLTSLKHFTVAACVVLTTFACIGAMT
jgi:uncharacterized membrane protein YcjF (UPF0283 family)